MQWKFEPELIFPPPRRKLNQALRCIHRFDKQTKSIWLRHDRTELIARFICRRIIISLWFNELFTHSSLSLFGRRRRRARLFFCCLFSVFLLLLRARIFFGPESWTCYYFRRILYLLLKCVAQYLEQTRKSRTKNFMLSRWRRALTCIESNCRSRIGANILRAAERVELQTSACHCAKFF